MTIVNFLGIYTFLENFFKILNSNKGINLNSIGVRLLKIKICVGKLIKRENSEFSDLNK